MSRERMLRVNELIKREVSDLCEQRIVPQLDALLTVTAVKTSPDLHHALVLVSVMGDTAKQEEALHLLRRERAMFQERIARHIQLRYTPVLQFRLDHTLAEADRVLALIESLEVAPAGEAPLTDAPPAGASARD